MDDEFELVVRPSSQTLYQSGLKTKSNSITRHVFTERRPSASRSMKNYPETGIYLEVSVIDIPTIIGMLALNLARVHCCQCTETLNGTCVGT